MASGEALFNPYLPEFHADPYPFYRRLRAVAPVYDDVLTVLRDPRFGRDGFEQMLAAFYADDRAESSRLPGRCSFGTRPTTPACERDRKSTRLNSSHGYI